eukprot:Opistho-2@12331
MSVVLIVLALVHIHLAALHTALCLFRSLLELLLVAIHLRIVVILRSLQLLLECSARHGGGLLLRLGLGGDRRNHFAVRNNHVGVDLHLARLVIFVIVFIVVIILIIVVVITVVHVLIRIHHGCVVHCGGPALQCHVLLGVIAELPESCLVVGRNLLNAELASPSTDNCGVPKMRTVCSGRARVEGNLARVPVLQNGLCCRLNVRNATLAQLSTFASKVDEEFVGIGKRGNAIQLHNLLGDAAAEDDCNRLKGIRQLLDLHAIPQNNVTLAASRWKDNAGAVEEANVFVEVDELRLLGHARGRPNVHSTCALKTVNKRTFSDIRIADNSNRDGSLNVDIPAVILEQFDEGVRPQTLARVQQLIRCERGGHLRLAEVTLLRLSGGLECNGGQFLAENTKPLFGDVAGNEINLVHDKHYLLVCTH